jgi:inorganic pyrophosphatase
VDRPQLTSSLPPTLYGFIPRTYCGARVARFAPGSTYGDRDPMDICVLTERPIHRQTSPVHIHHLYGPADAHAVIRAAMDDYAELIAQPGAG